MCILDRKRQHEALVDCGFTLHQPCEQQAKQRAARVSAILTAYRLCHQSNKEKNTLQADAGGQALDTISLIGITSQ